jgi:MFS family permease
MKEGLNFIFHHAALLFVILALAAGLFVMGCFGPLIAVFVRDTLHASSRLFAICSAGIGIGLFIGITILNAIAKKVTNTALVYFGLGGIAVGTLMMAVAPHIVLFQLAAHTAVFHLGSHAIHLHLAPHTVALDTLLTVLGCFTIGFACGGIIIPSQTMIQQETPPAMLGRVGSTVMSLVFSAQIAGLILSGVLANHTSVRRVFLICTVMLAVLMAAGKLWMEPGEHPEPAT